MINDQKYVILSLELHLFFARIMKEHSIFLEAGFTPKDSKLAKEADNYKLQFEEILSDTIRLGNGIIREDVLDYGEFFTDYTLSSEGKTQKLTGIAINQKLTLMELKLNCEKMKHINSETVKNVKKLNKKVFKLVECLINLKIRVLDSVLSCELFTTNYPSLIKHKIREAKLYQSYIVALENKEDIEDIDIKATEVFWNEIMKEHALFIRGLLDPSENTLINTADKFAKEYKDLLEKINSMTDVIMSDVTNEILYETINIRDFKQAGAKGIDECKIQAIFLPLLADHVLREANHYIRLLENYKKYK